MKSVPEDASLDDPSLHEDITVDPIVRGFVKDWDAMEDLLHHVLYTGLGWEIGNEGQILFTDPLSTPKVSFSSSRTFNFSNSFFNFNLNAVWPPK